MIKITTPKGILKVSRDTEIPITFTNPMFNELGSHSLPFTVPWCKHNLMVLGHPERVGSAYNANLEMECKLESKSFIANGILQIMGISEGSSIDLCLKTRDGGFWDWAKNTRLRDIAIPHEAIDLSMEGFQTVKNDYFNGVWPDVDFSFAPVATDFQSLDYYEQEDSYSDWSGRKLCISDYVLWNNPGDLYRNDSDRTSSIAPFVYLNAVVHWVCSSYGYRINENFLASTAELRSAILLNRAYNLGFLGGFSIQPKYLLPNVSVMEFIDTTEKAFGCRFFVTHKTRSINVISVGSRFLATPIKIDGSVSIAEKNEGGSLHFKAKRVSSPYSKVTDRAINNSFFTFETQLPPIVDGKVYQTSLGVIDFVTYPNKIVFSQSLQAYFFFEWVEGSEQWEYKARCIHSQLYDLKVNNDFVSINVDYDGYFAPMVPVTCRQFYKNGTENAYFDYSIIVPFLNQWDWLQSFEDGFIGDNKEEAPIVFAFNRGRIVDISFPVTLFDINSFSLPWASTDVYDKNGLKISGANLAIRFAGNYGIYENFYTEFEAFYNNNLNKIELKNANKNSILSANIEDVLLVDGVRVMIDKLELTIKPEDNYISNVRVLSLKPYI